MASRKEAKNKFLKRLGLITIYALTVATGVIFIQNILEGRSYEIAFFVSFATVVPITFLAVIGALLVVWLAGDAEWKPQFESEEQRRKMMNRAKWTQRIIFYVAAIPLVLNFFATQQPGLQGYTHWPYILASVPLGILLGEAQTRLIYYWIVNPASKTTHETS